MPLQVARSLRDQGRQFKGAGTPLPQGVIGALWFSSCNRSETTGHPRVLKYDGTRDRDVPDPPARAVFSLTVTEAL